MFKNLAGHPSVIGFISHCGLNSASEAVYHGVPILGLPITFDQPRVCARREHQQEAIVLSWETLNVDVIMKGIMNITQNEKLVYYQLLNY